MPAEKMDQITVTSQQKIFAAALRKRSSNSSSSHETALPLLLLIFLPINFELPTFGLSHVSHIMREVPGQNLWLDASLSVCEKYLVDTFHGKRHSKNLSVKSKVNQCGKKARKIGAR